MKIAVLGTGAVATNNYLPFLSKQPGLSLALYSRTRAKAEACATKFGGRVAASIEDLLSDQPDAVLILTKENDRFDAALSVLKHRPKRVLFEKPLVAAQGQAQVGEQDFICGRELLARAEETGTQTAMIFNYRFFEHTLRTKRIIRERNLGALLHANVLSNYACWSHCIDLLHFFGGSAAEISALAGAEHQRARSVCAAFKLQNGATGTILGSADVPFDLSLYQMTFCFERGTVHCGDLDGSLRVHETRAHHVEAYPLAGNYSRWDQYKQSFERALAAYLAAVAAGAPAPIPGRAGVEELQFEAALQRSIAQQRPVAVQDEFPVPEAQTATAIS